VLLDQVLDDQLLMAMDPTREGEEYTTCRGERVAFMGRSDQESETSPGPWPSFRIVRGPLRIARGVLDRPPDQPDLGREPDGLGHRARTVPASLLKVSGDGTVGRRPDAPGCASASARVTRPSHRLGVPAQALLDTRPRPRPRRSRASGLRATGPAGSGGRPVPPSPGRAETPRRTLSSRGSARR